MKRFLVLVTAVVMVSAAVVFGAKSVSHSTPYNATIQDVPDVYATAMEGSQPSGIITQTQIREWQVVPDQYSAAMEGSQPSGIIATSYATDDPDALINALYTNPTALQDAIGAGLDAALGVAPRTASGKTSATYPWDDPAAMGAGLDAALGVRK